MPENPLKPSWLDENNQGVIDAKNGASIVVKPYEGKKKLVWLSMKGECYSHESLHTASVELMRLSLYLKSLEN
jgi:hypothetical protein